jgi:hypothetical protein
MSITHALELALPDWPDFRYDVSAPEPFEQKFLLSSGEILGAAHHVNQSDAIEQG